MSSNKDSKYEPVAKGMGPHSNSKTRRRGIHIIADNKESGRIERATDTTSARSAVARMKPQDRVVIATNKWSGVIPSTVVRVEEDEQERMVEIVSSRDTHIRLVLNKSDSTARPQVESQSSSDGKTSNWKPYKGGELWTAFLVFGASPPMTDQE